MIKIDLTKLKNNSFNYLLLISSVFATLSTALYFTAKFIEKIFGKLTVNQLLFNVRTKGAGGAQKAFFEEYFWNIVSYSIRAIVVISVIWAVYYLASRRYSVKQVLAVIINAANKIYRAVSLRAVIFVVLICLGCYFVQYVDRKFKVVKYLKQEDSLFIKNHYAFLDGTSFSFIDEKRRNLIVIFLESVESGFSNEKVYGENLIPELKNLEKEGLTLRGYKKTQGGYFTLDGISAQFLGVPVTQLPYDIHNMRNNHKFGGLLNKSPSIFNILKNAGYDTASFHGTSREFTHKGVFLKQHGFNRSFFSEDWKKMGYALDENTKGRWDYNDTFLMARFKEWLTNRNTEPFAVFFETVDTHFPVGFTPEEYRVKGNHQEALRYTSKLMGDFVKWAKEQPWYSNTTIVIVGDHLWQDFQNDFTELTKKDRNRGIYNVILNPVRKDTHVRTCGFTAMDMAPTILNAMGIEFTSIYDNQISHSRLGLGRSLFDKGENLVCRYGKDYLIQNFNEYSSFYNSLH